MLYNDISICLVVMAAYLVAVGVYYGFSVIMRWIRAIQ
nr:MAG TPA: protein of unknown function (DUF4834) [Inoviridae sp.]